MRYNLRINNSITNSNVNVAENLRLHTFSTRQFSERTVIYQNPTTCHPAKKLKKKPIPRY